MLFNSIEFAVFLILVFFLYWFICNKNLKIQNLLILIASYVFYGWWNWKFLILILISSFTDYFIGIGLLVTSEQVKRKILLILSLIVNLGILCIFKYYNFFISNFYAAFSSLGLKPNLSSLNLILPVGISFYTFQTLSYSVDVYNRKLKPTKDIISFLAFVSFFPQLVAGPIERAKNLLPQFYKRRFFEYNRAVDGMRQILWGLFKKIIIADNCAIYVNKIFGDYTNYSGSTLLAGVFFFSFQIYGDFSGYSDIAIGVSKLFGFDLMKNFAFPYFSRDIAEFWRRWHISLTTWFRDYVYIPLGGSRCGKLKSIRNILIVFIISGLWHGANWTFIVWGGLNAIYFLPLVFLKKHKDNLNTVSEGKLLPTLKDILNIGITFVLVMFAWVFFRAETVNDAFKYIYNIFSVSLFSIPNVAVKLDMSKYIFFTSFIFFILIEWFQREKQHSLQFDNNRVPSILKWCLYYTITIAILYFGGSKQEFIYFQF